MKIRGRRECQDCGRRWSYYRTGDVECPDCGSLRSVGVDDRTRHTDGAPTLDLSPYRDDAPENLGAVAADLTEDLRAYARRRGFVVGGDLREPDDRYLCARELRQALSDLERGHSDRVAAAGDRSVDAVGDGGATDRYLLALFRVADGDDAADRPAPAAVPERFRPARGLAYATALATHRSEAATYLDDDPDPAVRTALGRLRDRVARVEALDGEVAPARVETLVRAARELTRAATDGDEAALSTAQERLSALE
ncbi:MAG: hypothetical protein ABEJ79_01970 [Halolamina sp.]